MRPRKFQTTRQRSQKAEALARLKSSWQKDHPDEEWNPEREPEITPMLRKNVDGGISKVIEALRMHSDEDAVAFIETWDSITVTDHRYLTVEDIAHAAGIGSLRLAEVAQTALFLHGNRRTSLLLSSHLPDVVEKSLRLAKTDKGIYDREMMLKAGGVLPIPKSAQIAIQNNYGEKEEEKPAPRAVWKDAGQRLREFYNLTDPKRLPSPPSAPVSPGGHIDRLQTETAEIIRDDE